MVINLWERLHPFFELRENESHPEIEIANLTVQSLEILLHFILIHSRGLETDIAIREPFRRIRVSSHQHIVTLLAHGEVIGELFLSLRMEAVNMPEMGFFIDGPDYVSVQYVGGSDWSPIHVITLFEFLRFVKKIETSAYIGLSKDSFPLEHRKYFAHTLNEYLNEQISFT